MKRGFSLSADQAREMASAIRSTAARIGVSPEHLASIMSFETGGTLNPWQAGPHTQHGQHRGLIQWGEPQARQYGVGPNSSITEQVQSAGRYLQDRGVRPGMPLQNIYSAVLAGNASIGLNRRDKNGTSPISGAANMQRTEHRNALSRLDQLSGAPAQPAAPPVDQSKSVAFKRPLSPAPVQAAPSSVMGRFNPISSAQAATLPPSSTLSRINPKDPSGPLLPAASQAPAPVQRPVSTPEAPPVGTGSSWRDASARMRSLGGTYAPGVSETTDFRTQFGDSSRRGVMLDETPYAVTMAGSQEYLRHAPPAPVQAAPPTPAQLTAPRMSPMASQQLPTIDVGRVPQGPSSGYHPVTPGYEPMTSDPTQYQPIQTPVSTPAVDPGSMPAPAPVTLPETSPGATFTPAPEPPIEFPTATPTPAMPEGDTSSALASLAEALGNLGGGGGGSAPMPNPTSGGADALQTMASMPDFPRIGDQYGALMQQRGAQVDAPAGLPQAPAFNLKPIGQAGMQPNQTGEGFARPALKRLFTA